MVREDKSTWKASYFQKLVQLLDEYPKCFIVGADNVGSKQMQEIRIALRGKAVVLMGKNTMMRKAIRGHLEKNPDLERLLPHIKNNVGFVFTKEELTLVRYITVSQCCGSIFFQIRIRVLGKCFCLLLFEGTF
jgi:large subunit ribosomal protein LP0